MAPALRLVLALAVAACCAAAVAAAGGRVDLWPMPASVSRGAKTLYVAKDLKLSTAGSTYADGKAILADAFRRMLAVVQMDHAINGSYRGLPVLAGVKVAVHSLDDEVCKMDVLFCELLCRMLLCFSNALHFAVQLKFGVDESYKLTVPATGNPIYAQVEVSERSPLNLKHMKQ
jgi:hexosaminidase